MRLIDADALIDDVVGRYCKDCDKRKGIKNGKWRVVYEIGEAPCRACDVDDMIYELENAPTVDAEPVRHGHWIINDKYRAMGEIFNRCSVCGFSVKMLGTDNPNLWDYCPNCGAKMDEVDEVEE